MVYYCNHFPSVFFGCCLFHTCPCPSLSFCVFSSSEITISGVGGEPETVGRNERKCGPPSGLLQLCLYTVIIERLNIRVIQLAFLSGTHVRKSRCQQTERATKDSKTIIGKVSLFKKAHGPFRSAFLWQF